MDYFGIIFLSLAVVALLDRCHAKAVGPSPQYREEALHVVNSIFHKYNWYVAPLPFPDPVTLDIHMSLVTVQGLDVTAQCLQSVVDLEIEWSDKRLQWFPQMVFKVKVELEKVWKPDISILNALEPPVVVSGPDLAVMRTGTIYWFRRLQLRTYCRTNSSNIEDPTDCVISLGSRLYHNGEQDFSNTTNSFDVSSAYSDNKWKVVGHGVERTDRTMELPAQAITEPDNKTAFYNYTELHFHMDIERTGDYIQQAESLPLEETNSVSRDYMTSSTLLLVMLIPLYLS